MTEWPPAPPGFERVPADGAAVYVAAGDAERIRAAGLDRRAGWSDRLAAAGAGERPGRGPVAIDREAGLVIKRLRRGGLSARFLGDRAIDAARLLGNLTTVAEARRRGVATPAVPALLARSAGPGRYRGWLAVDLESGEDLRVLVGRDPRAAAGAVRAAMAAVRRGHEAGLRHRDLNLGNVLLVADGSARLLDLDRADLLDGPVPFARRFRELLRFERSWLRVAGAVGPGPDDREPGLALIRAYVAGDEAMARRFHRWRPTARLLLRLRGAVPRFPGGAR